MAVTQKTWFIIDHPHGYLTGVVDEGQNITTNYPTFEFHSETEWKEKMEELDIEDEK